MSAHQMNLVFPALSADIQANEPKDVVAFAPPWNVKKDGLLSVIHPTSKIKDAVRNDAVRTIAMIEEINASPMKQRKKIARQMNLDRMKRAASVLAMYAGIKCPDYFRGKKWNAGFEQELG